MPSTANPAAPERQYPLRMPSGWVAPVPAWKSTFADSVSSVSMCVIGFQHTPEIRVMGYLRELSAVLVNAAVCDFASSDAGQGMQETVCIAYWLDATKAQADLSCSVFKTMWSKHMAAEFGYGVFCESINVPFDRSETLFSGPVHAHGMSQSRLGVEGPIPHHQYWGGMRDRIPLAARDSLSQSDSLRIVEQSDTRVLVTAHENLCIIRSGQDWSQCDVQQLGEYRDTIEPILKAGMSFLRDHGEQVNCYSCRYMRDLNSDGTDVPRSFGLACFRTMKDLEDWAEHHPTHLAIFNTFLGIAQQHGPDLQLRLWHEVSVLPADGQWAEYVNCRPGTGWLGGI
ncbi:phenylacetaldoxime dehydratase family protein [Granulosicoccus antarcticus]|uniref:Phenylacetaldoxime dehydratase n=1 Tax=Granulosicoccus antarcticus IMCC3135 TaxID=1192854 RepID=A0A2Z2NIZ7_9GAMM|nr:phenylacetaldoxime dehydratase family protein [Granulosicoccus antarcticus]ASJ71139.1 Phenylacetaldoxime dehydratase [Granulosicoccus antarcticus IMCC3135]